MYSEKAKRTVGIEVMPSLKSCEQGCPQCPLANIGGHKVKQSVIDPEVQKSFSNFERYLSLRDYKYDIHYTSQLDLFPKIKKPKLMRMARFQTHKSISEKNSAVAYSESIRKVIGQYKIDPTEICFSFVPKSPVLTSKEIEVIRDVFEEISSWYLKDKKGKKLTCTIRSNFIPLKKLERAKNDLDTRDRDILHQITSNLFKNQRDTPGRFKSSYDEDMYGNTYLSIFTKKIMGNKFELSNRVITHTTQLQRDISIDTNPEIYKYCFEIQQAFYFSNSRLQPGVLFEPGGVMLNHSSVSINNPIMWLTHKDFRRSLRKLKDKKSFTKVIDDLVISNCAMFDYLLKEECKETGINFLRKVDKNQILGFFELNRKMFS